MPWRWITGVTALTAVTATVGTLTAHAILGGLPIAEFDFPSVKLVRQGPDGVCTGTVITPTAILTAAHCVFMMVSANTPSAVSVDGQAPLAIRIHPKYASQLPDHLTYDVAVLRFRRPFASVSPLSPLAPKEKQPVVLIGYGMSAFADVSTLGIKRAGRNVIAVRLPGGIGVIGSVRDFGRDPGRESGAAVPLRGDSGGPLFALDGSVLGVASQVAATGPGGADTYASYVDVTDPEIAQFIREASR